MKYLVWSEGWCCPRNFESLEEAQEVAKEETSSENCVYVIEASHMWYYYVPDPLIEVEQEF